MCEPESGLSSLKRHLVFPNRLLQCHSNLCHFLYALYVAPTNIGLAHISYNKEIFYNEGGKTLVQVSQRGGGCSILGKIQDQVVQGPQQPDLVEDVPVYCRGELDCMAFKCPFQLKPFYDSMLLISSYVPISQPVGFFFWQVEKC